MVEAAMWPPGDSEGFYRSIFDMSPLSTIELLDHLDIGWPLADMVGQHHERMDGSGYPAGLKGDEIMLEARILAVADVVEAISSHRPYRPSLGLEYALAEISMNRVTHYDSNVVDACVLVMSEGFEFEDVV